MSENVVWLDSFTVLYVTTDTACIKCYICVSCGMFVRHANQIPYVGRGLWGSKGAAAFRRRDVWTSASIHLHEEWQRQWEYRSDAAHLFCFSSFFSLWQHTLSLSFQQPGRYISPRSVKVVGLGGKDFVINSKVEQRKNCPSMMLRMCVKWLALSLPASTV